MWWPGTELNRRRQPFQGCALPPELPGHYLRATLSAMSIRTTTDGGLGRALGALTGRDAVKQNSRCAGTVRNFRIITRRTVPSKWWQTIFAAPLLATFGLTKGDGRSARHSLSSARTGLRQTSTGSRDSHSPQTRQSRRLFPFQCCLCGPRFEAPRRR
jgi:hypothetical protein